MRLGYLAGLQRLQLCWNEIMNSVRLKSQTQIKIALKCILDHCEFEAVDTFERLSSLYMNDQNSNLNVRTCYNSCGALSKYARMQANYRYFHIMMSGPTGTPYEGEVTSSPSLSDAHCAVHVTWHGFFIHPAASQCQYSDSCSPLTSSRKSSSFLYHRFGMPDVAGLYWNASKGLSWVQVAIIAWSCSCLRVTPWSRPRREWKTSVLHFASGVSCRSASWQRSIIQTLRETLVSWPCMNINDVKQTHGCSHVYSPDVFP